MTIDDVYDNLDTDRELMFLTPQMKRFMSELGERRVMMLRQRITDLLVNDSEMQDLSDEWASMNLMRMYPDLHEKGDVITNQEQPYYDVWHDLQAEFQKEMVLQAMAIW